MAEKDWNPEDEGEPEKLQKEFLEMGKELIEEMKAKKKKATEDALKMELEGGQPVPIGPFVGIGAYKPPTFQEVSARLKRAWEETKKIAPDAPEFVQAEILRSLTNVPMDDDTQTA